MFEFTSGEYEALRSHFVTIKKGGSARGRHSKYAPFAFTEQGVAMLSSVLRSDKAAEVNIAIMRAFVLLRHHLADYKDLKKQITALEKEMNVKFKDIQQALNYLLSPQAQRKKIGGFKRNKN